MYTGASLASAWSADLEERHSRLLLRAALCSLVLHAVFLAFLPYLRESSQLPDKPPPLTARLATPKPPPEPPKAEPPPSLPVPQAPLVRPAAKSQLPPPVAAAAPAPAPVTNVEPPPATEPAQALPAGPPQPAARAEVQPPATASSPDPGNVARFRLELMEAALRYERYPRLARDNGWEGRVELRIAIAENGALAAIIVRKSSGRAVLDDQAQSMLRSAHPHVTVPASLRGKAFTLDIPVDFSIKELR